MSLPSLRSTEGRQATSFSARHLRKCSRESNPVNPKALSVLVTVFVQNRQMKDLSRQGSSQGDQHPFLKVQKVGHCHGPSLKLGHMGVSGQPEDQEFPNLGDRERKRGNVAFLTGICRSVSDMWARETQSRLKTRTQDWHAEKRQSYLGR